MKRACAFTIVAVGVLIAGCESVIGADFEATEHSCSHTPFPPRPERNPGAEEEQEAFAVVTDFDLGDQDAPDKGPTSREIGFDLDNTCTNRGQRPSCKGIEWTMPELTDGIDGIDNNGGPLIRFQTTSFLNSVPEFTSPTLSNEAIKTGTTAPFALLRIRGWNNRPNDDEVSLDWYLAKDLGGTKEKPRPARLDGSEEWPVIDTSVDTAAPLPPNSTAAISVYRDPHAYVVGHKLYARLPKGTPLNLKNVPFPTEGILVRLDLKLGSPPEILGGAMGALVTKKNLFAFMPAMTGEFGFAKVVCTDDGQYPLVKAYFCKFMDSHADGRFAPDEPCDAISMGASFKAAPVKLGPLVPAKELKGCPKETDPARLVDNCEP